MQPQVTTTLEDDIRELRALEAELERRDMLVKPDMWVQRRLKEHLWSKQREILRAVAKHRRVAVKSCHEVGKSFTAARVVGWWLDSNPIGEAFAVTSAPTAAQVRSILWREIGRLHAKGELKGRVNQTEWLAKPVAGKEELIAFGRKPDEYQPTAFQGIHARRVLVVFDEACGIPGGAQSLWEAADSLIANDLSKMLAIGNPDDPTSHFHEICKPGSGWHVITISAFDSPNFTGEPMPQPVLDQLIGRLYVEEKRKKWANKWFWINRHHQPCTPEEGVQVVCPEGIKREESAAPTWFSKVLGEFPEHAENGGLIPLSWIRAAQERDLTPMLQEPVHPGSTATKEQLEIFEQALKRWRAIPNRLGCDVGGGGDSSCVAHRRGPVVRVIREDHIPDTMVTTGNVIADLRRTGAEYVNVDYIGLGRGVVDRGREQNLPFVPIVSGEAAHDSESFANRRAELWWGLRERFESGDIDIDPEDQDLADELASIRYKRTSSGKIQIESKEEAKKRGVASPNRADAIMFAFAIEREPGDFGVTI